VKGGVREGAGRPATGIKKQLVALKLRNEVANALRSAIPVKQRSAFIEALIVKALEL